MHDVPIAHPARSYDLIQHVCADHVAGSPAGAFEQFNGVADAVRAAPSHLAFNRVWRQCVNECRKMHQRAEVIAMEIQELLGGQDWWRTHVVGQQR